MKRVVLGMMVVISMVLMISTVFAENEQLVSAPASREITVQLNGSIIDFTDSEGNVVNPKIIHDRTMVPMRKIFELLGATVEWEGETQSITATKDGIEIGLQIDNAIATVKNQSGEETKITLDSVPVIIDDRTLVPVRFIAETLDKKVDWDELNQTVIIINSNIISSTIKTKAPTLYQYLTDNKMAVDSYTAAGELSGKLKYTDSESRSNASNLTISGKYLGKVSEMLMAADAQLNITGKGKLKEAVDESNLEKVNAKIIFDGTTGSIYITGSMFEETFQDKWIKYVSAGMDAENYQVQINSMKEYQDKNTLEVLDILFNETEGLTVESYTMINEVLAMFCDLFGDTHFTVDTYKNTNTYTLNLTLADLLKSAKLTEEEMKQIEEVSSLVIDSVITTEDHIPTNTTTDIKFSYKEGTEEITGSFTLEEKIKDLNEKVEITLPEAKDVVEQTY